MGAGIFHLSYDPGPRCFSLSVRVLWSLSFAKDRITHPAAVVRVRSSRMPGQTRARQHLLLEQVMRLRTFMLTKT